MKKGKEMKTSLLASIALLCSVSPSHANGLINLHHPRSNSTYAISLPINWKEVQKDYNTGQTQIVNNIWWHVGCHNITMDLGGSDPCPIKGYYIVRMWKRQYNSIPTTIPPDKVTIYKIGE